MTTALGIITSAMRRAGILFKTESPSADEASDGLEMLNDLLAAWSNDSLLLYARTLENFTLTLADGEYTIGSGGDFSTTRPLKIVSAYIRNGQTDYPLTLITDEAYAAMSVKSIQGISEYLNYTNDFPLGKIKLYPVPSSAYPLYLLSEKQLSSFTLNQTVSLPPGWDLALKSNLSILMAPEYGQQVPIETAEVARESLGLLRSNAMRNRSMDAMPAGRTPNIYSGYFR